MWMMYATEIEIVNLEGGVNNLSDTFSKLRFDAEHETLYGAVK